MPWHLLSAQHTTHNTQHHAKQGHHRRPRSRAQPRAGPAGLCVRAAVRAELPGGEFLCCVVRKKTSVRGARTRADGRCDLPTAGRPASGANGHTHLSQGRARDYAWSAPQAVQPYEPATLDGYQVCVFAPPLFLPRTDAGRVGPRDRGTETCCTRLAWSRGGCERSGALVLGAAAAAAAAQAWHHTCLAAAACGRHLSSPVSGAHTRARQPTTHNYYTDAAHRDARGADGLPHGAGGGVRLWSCFFVCFWCALGACCARHQHPPTTTKTKKQKNSS